MKKLKLDAPFASNRPVKAQDTLFLARALNRLGFYTPDVRLGLTNIPNARLIKAVKNFQLSQGLIPTGELRPMDETVQAVNLRLAENPVGEYIWHTKRDEKVRTAHAAREGQAFSWTDPPEGGNPGEEFGCRCWAEPIENFVEEIGNKIDKVLRTKKEFLNQTVISPITESVKKWGDTEFGLHFYLGGGKDVDLSEMGYLSNVIEITRQSIFWKVENQVAQKMREIKSGPLVYSTKRPYSEFKSVHWALGNSVVSSMTIGKVVQYGDRLYIDAKVKYEFSDEITDPINIRQNKLGYHSFQDLPDFYSKTPDQFSREAKAGGYLRMTDFFASAFTVRGSWETKMDGYVIIDDEK